MCDVPGFLPAEARCALLPVLAWVVDLAVDLLVVCAVVAAELAGLAGLAEAARLAADGFAGLPLPVATRLTALETFAANENSGTSKRPAASPPPSQMNLRRLAEDKPLPSSSGSVTPPPWA